MIKETTNLIINDYLEITHKSVSTLTANEYLSFRSRAEYELGMGIYDFCNINRSAQNNKEINRNNQNNFDYTNDNIKKNKTNENYTQEKNNILINETLNKNNMLSLMRGIKG